MDFNLAGHVIEASSSTWQRFMGSIHNAGHGVFGSNQVQVNTAANRNSIFRMAYLHHWK